MVVLVLLKGRMDTKLGWTLERGNGHLIKTPEYFVFQP